jgi:hypothetical protein
LRSAYEISSNIFKKRLYDIYIADTLTTSPVLPVRVQYDPKESLMISLWIAYIAADIHEHALENNING